MKVKKIIAFFLAACFLSLFTLAACDTKNENNFYTELGIPSSEKHKQGVASRCVWDMKVFDGGLFIGGGDYDKNTGPTDIWRYDLKKQEWGLSGTVEDEAVLRFVEINDTLIVPGTDPKENWEFGNYYRFNGQSWDKVRNIDGGIHNFDMIKFGDKIFAGLGVNTDPELLFPLASPIACSTDGGQNFEEVELYKDGQPYRFRNKDIVVRTYEFLAFENTLYAVVRKILTQTDEETNVTETIEGENLVFRYENDAFYYYSDFPSEIENAQPGVSMFNAKAEFKGKALFTTGYLYSTTDMKNYEKIAIGNLVVCDLLVENGVLYALCGIGSRQTGYYTVSVYKNTTGLTDGFTEVFKFDYYAPAISFEKYGDDFYLGIGNRAKVFDHN